MKATSLHKRNIRGFSLVELMVGIVVGLLTVLAIVESFTFFEGQKRTTIGGATAAENGLLASFIIERDARMAGFGMAGISCATINAHTTTPAAADFTLPSFSVTITQNTATLKNPSTATVGTDTVEIIYSSSPFGSIPGIIQTDMPDSSYSLNVDNGVGFTQNQLILISQGTTDCALIQASADSIQTGTPNVTGPGTQWNVPTATGAAFHFNAVTFPAGGYTSGAKAMNMGNLVYRRYYISNNNLMVDELTTTGTSAGALATQTLVNGIISMKAHYGNDTGTDGYVDAWGYTAPTSNDKLVALRIGLLARVGVYEKTVVTPSTTISLWPSGPTATITTDEQHYRYKSFYTTIPLRNTIWNN